MKSGKKAAPAAKPVARKRVVTTTRIPQKEPKTKAADFTND